MRVAELYVERGPEAHEAGGELSRFSLELYDESTFDLTGMPTPDPEPTDAEVATG